MEAIDLSESTVNPPNTRVGPENFELLKVLGKGGYGKVSVFRVPCFFSLLRFLLLGTVNNSYAFLISRSSLKELENVYL